MEQITITAATVLADNHQCNDPPAHRQTRRKAAIPTRRTSFVFELQTPKNEQPRLQVSLQIQDPYAIYIRRRVPCSYSSPR